jgi:outer membrane protein assembly factor BamB
MHAHGLWRSLLVVGDKVIFTAGGTQTSVVALDRSTGNTVWKSPSQGGTSCFVSPICIQANNREVVVTATTEALLGIYADTGELAWKRRGVNWAVTPLYDNGRLYDGNNVFVLNGASADVSIAWTHTAKGAFGHFVRLGDRLYSGLTAEGKPCILTCTDWQTGKALYEVEGIHDVSLTAAEGLVYAYEHNGGRVLLIQPQETSARIVGSFRIQKGSGPHYAHPVISHGRLYLRHGDYLMAYDVRGKNYGETREVKVR